MVFSKEFKQAVLSLPQKDKDQLLLRLLKKDIKLVNRLGFELLSEQTADEIRGQIYSDIEKRLKNICNRNLHPIDLSVELRSWSGVINEHVFTCKDKFGEVELNLLLIEVSLKNFPTVIWQKYPSVPVLKLQKYLGSKLFRCGILIQKLDEDEFLELDEKLLNIHQQLNKNSLAKEWAEHLGWKFTTCREIPQNIEQQYKNLRSRKLL